MRSNKTVGTPVARKSTEEIELTGRAVTRVKSPPEFSGVDHDLDRGPTATYRAAVSRATAPGRSKGPESTCATAPGRSKSLQE